MFKKNILMSKRNIPMSKKNVHMFKKTFLCLKGMFLYFIGMFLLSYKTFHRTNFYYYQAYLGRTEVVILTFIQKLNYLKLFGYFKLSKIQHSHRRATRLAK